MFTNFSVLPLRLASCAGFFFAFLGLAGAAWFAVNKLRHPDLPVGWASQIVSLFVVSGVQLFALGMIGEYLGRLFLKDNGQPQFVVRERYHCQDQASTSTETSCGAGVPPAQAAGRPAQAAGTAAPQELRKRSEAA